ncbi:3-hydroxyacyl-CoA dehydrogenase family protein [Arthrobacter sp. Y-9]|uniref:3-hydroxyacyl-CoA dehydrogenase family protein n=1 Tax=Arthrobacter sp. Y-9 TaxID=3039385 RepID=UPI00241E30C1|nr:3-hydroxyacyl-CoA dehydrogenase family protein [Arthrobacter sp. Y-9]WFR83465.1 3-hydroxyacyl-CoA dehydrogenase family protein [Arthrobacter sp. Y-9]
MTSMATAAIADRLVHGLRSRTIDVSRSTGLSLPTIAHTLFLGCGIPASVSLGTDAAGSFSGAFEQPLENIKRVGVLGAGTMGVGIAQAVAHAGISVAVYGRREGPRLAAVGEALRTAAGGRTAGIYVGSDLQVVSRSDVIIEAIAEDPAAKVEVLEDVWRMNPGPPPVFATTTSSLSITELQRRLGDRLVLVGAHFFNPASTNPLVELIQGNAPREALDRVAGLCRRLGKSPTVVPDTPGFVVNRVLIPYLNDFFGEISRGVDIRALDQHMRKLYRLPLGPSRLADLIGLDVVLAIQESLAERESDLSLRPAPLLKALVKNGILGRKSGHALASAPIGLN